MTVRSIAQAAAGYKQDIAYDLDYLQFTGSPVNRIYGLGYNLNDFEFKSDGTKIFTIDNDGGARTVRVWDLSTAWDVTTISEASPTFDVSSEDGQFRGIKRWVRSTR